MELFVPCLEQKEVVRDTISRECSCHCHDMHKESLFVAVKETLNLSGQEWDEMVVMMNEHPTVKLIAGRFGEENSLQAKALATEASA